MHMQDHIRRTATLFLLLCVVASTANGQGIPGLEKNTCLAGKTKCARQLLAATLKCRELCQKNPKKCGDAQEECEARISAKYDGGDQPEKGCFAKVEAKAVATDPTSLCARTGDSADMAEEAAIVADAILARLEGAPAPSCGDGAINLPGEQCDRSDLGGFTCEDFGLPGGTLTCSPACTLELHSCHAAVKHAFVTSESYSGALGGGLGADSTCTLRARIANLPGTYRAWLWDGGGTWPGNWPLGRANLPYMLPDGTLLAEDWATLTATSSDVPPINVDEFGDRISRAPFRAWANVGSTGRFLSDVSCGGWLFNVFAHGTTGAINGNFSSTGTFWSTQDCYEPARLYCFEQ